MKHPTVASDPELTQLIERTRDYVMSPDQRLAQRRSWVIGEVMLEHPEMSRDEVAQRVDRVIQSESWRGLYKLIEEMGELGQVLGKMGAFPHGDHPDGGPPLRQRLEQELADVEAAILYFREVNGLNPMPTRRVEKMQKFREWGLSGI